MSNLPEDITEELAAEAKIDTEKLRHVIINILQIQITGWYPI